MSGKKVAAIQSQPVVEREFISVAEAEALTGISRWTWRVYAYKGRISSVKVGKRLLLPIVEVRRLLAEGSRPREQRG